MVASPTSVRLAVAADLPEVQRIAVAAGRRFATSSDPRVARCADDPPPATSDLEAAVADGRLWVAVDHDGAAPGAPVGFLLALLLDGSLHVEEVAVDPDHEGRGHGTRLLDAAEGAAAAAGRPALTLTTFAEVPWNRPWYERRGFVVLAAEEQAGELRDLRADEAEHGLDPTIRVVMRRPIRAAAADSPRSGSSS